MAFCGRPGLLFLDEPTVGLEVRARETMWAIPRRLVDCGSAIVLTTHYLEEAEALADRVAVLSRGRMIASGTMCEMRALVVRARITRTTGLRVEEVAAWPGVGSVVRARQKLHITATNSEAVVRQCYIAADCVAQELEIRRAGFAEVSSELTQEVAA